MKKELLEAIRNLNDHEINELAESLAPLLAKVLDMWIWRCQEKEINHRPHNDVFSRPNERLFNALNDRKRG